jgi:glycerol-3-phosphate dehydrogenase (NAD(P)+)
VNVRLWAYEPEVVEGLNRSHVNPYYLNTAQLPDTVQATTDFSEVLDGAHIVVSVVPSKALRQVWQKHGHLLSPEAIVVSCTKGIEEGSFKIMTQVLEDCLPGHPLQNITALSGPSFAREVALGLPTSVVLAGRDDALLLDLQELFRTPVFMTFTSHDVIGVQIGGALKNILAIATGISDGLGLGHNSRAATITLGLSEIIRLGRYLGAEPLTFAGLSGVGDLVLTCTGALSRNYTLGVELGKGRTLNDVMGHSRMVAEGAETAKAVYHFAVEKKISMPICNRVYRILFEGLSPQEAMKQLCAFRPKEELS